MRGDSKSEVSEMYPNEIEDWDIIEKRAEQAKESIIIEAAKRAKVLFDYFGFTWKPDRDKPEFVPTLKQIVKRFKDGVDGVVKYELSVGSGRLYTRGVYEEGDLAEIEFLFKLGRIPIQYFCENAPIVAEEMKRDNRRR